MGSHGGHRPPPPALERAGIRLGVHDLADTDHCKAFLRDAAPDFVFHLAGQTGVGFQDAIASHVAATTNLLEAARLLASNPVIVVPGSSAQFGDVAEEQQPIAEDTRYAPGTLYGIAKATEAWTAAYFQKEHGMRIVRTHTFNCIGPGQRPHFVPATFACQVAAMERGTVEPVLRVGNLDALRDMTDIRDVAEAYVRIAMMGQPGQVYNICSGRPVSIRSVVEGLRAIAHIPFEIQQDPARRQAVDVPVQRGDASKLQRETGWRPSVTLEQSLADVLQEWRAHV
jgi:GDP-4-dehydro-6-deoxy-D-mannose reductase